MLRRLHLQLTLLYVLAGLALILLVAVGAYRLLCLYFEQTTDLALQHRMASELAALGVAVPAELLEADSAWRANQLPWSPIGNNPTPKPHDEEDSEGEERHSGGEAGHDAYDGELAAVFVLPLDANGTLLSNPNPYSAPPAPDLAAALAAMANGRDWRTVTLDDGTRIRLLTYRLPGDDERPAVLQAGRPLDDQDRLLARLLLGLLALGAIALALLSASSWWLARRSLAPAQSAWERQQAFVANASHELRTPLTLIRASTEVARRALPESEHEACTLLGDVLQECDHTSRLVEDLLLLSRLDSGHLVCERRPIVVDELLGDLRRQVGRVAETRGVQLIVDDGGAVVEGDPARLRQVLLILLDNALRHTPAGGMVRLTARTEHRQVRLQVSDTGAGIAPEHLPHLFNRFYRVDDARGHGDGAGLGLAIARALVTAQRGRIAIESRTGAGTQVSVTLPAAGG